MGKSMRTEDDPQMRPLRKDTAVGKKATCPVCDGKGLVRDAKTHAFRPCAACVGAGMVMVKPKTKS